MLQTVICKCLPCAGCKVIAERTASKRKRRCSKAGGKNHQRTGNQGGYLTCNQRFPPPEDIGDNTGGEFKAEAHDMENTFEHPDLQQRKSTECEQCNPRSRRNLKIADRGHKI